MRDGGRIAAAIEVFDEVVGRGRPVRLALKAWGEAARYAGSGDRAFVSGLVLDALRQRRSLAWRMGSEAGRALMLGVLGLGWGWEIARLAEAAADPAHGPGALDEAETAALSAPRSLDEAPAPVRGDYPDWLEPHLTRVFGEARAGALAAQAARAPVDLRVNALKTDRDRVMKALAAFDPRPHPALPDALRIAPPTAQTRAPAVESAPEFQKGWFEVQDLGSQIAAALAGEIKGAQVLDYCAGGGGKTLALAAAMANRGQIFAYDSDARRLAETVTRSQRAGVRNLQVRSPLRADALADLEGRMDLVFADAPCTGSGVWRRHPDAKWRLSPDQLARRMGEQDAVLDGAARYVRPGGRLLYVTCSLFAEENEDRIGAFLGRRGAFRVIAAEPPGDLPLTSEGYLRLGPHQSGTDGFFAAVLERAA